MGNLTDLSIRRPVATTMVYLIILTLGISGLRFLPIDLLPEIEFPTLAVRAVYPNVGPEEMEILVTQRIENAVAGIQNLRRVTSNSSEGAAIVRLEFPRGTDLSDAANDVREAIDRVTRLLPPDMDPPRIWRFDPNQVPVMNVAVSSRTHDLEALTRILERDLTRRFEQLPGVGSIDVRGGINREIRVDLNRERLRATGVTAREVQQAISREGTVAPGGVVKDGLRDLYVRAFAEYENIEQIADVVIRRFDGVPLRVRDVATVETAFEPTAGLIEVDGAPVVMFRAQKQADANIVAVARAIRGEVDRINAERADVSLQVVADQSEFIKSSISNVRTSALWGGLLAIVVLYFFLRNVSSTGIISLSIPISVVATFGLLFFSGLSLNQMTFGGLALGIGLIVDNAIVVLENIVRRREENKEGPLKAASVGTREVAGAIVASTLTTSVIFLPVVFMTTITAVLFMALALVVVFSLVCSLFVALTLVPMLASRFLVLKKDRVAEPHSKARRRSSFRDWFVRLEHRYARFVGIALRQRLLVFGTTAALIVGSVYLFRLVPVELAPETDANEIRVTLRMDQGTNVAVVRSYLNELEEVVMAALEGVRVENVLSDMRWGMARIDIALPNPEERTVRSAELADRIRDAVSGVVPGVQVQVRAQSGLWILRRLFSGGDSDEAVQIEIAGFDQELAVDIGRDIRDRIEGIPGVRDVRVGREEDVGQPEQRILIDRDRVTAMGLTVQEVAEAIQLSVGGGRAGVFREQGEEFNILVRLRPDDRLTTLDLENIAVRTANGSTIPLSAVTTQQRARSAAAISRVNGQRVNYVTANLETGVVLSEAVGAIRESLRDLPLPPGFSISFGGEYEEQERARRDFMIAILLAMALIYMVMAAQFERFLDPLIVMFSVPVALVGVAPILWLTNTTFNIQSLMGLVMLIGIVVNNAIVLVDYINLMRRDRGLELVPAVIEAGRLRLRPILMTTCTTILGLLPLAIGYGAGGEIQAALARTVIGGLAASTLITLLLIPVVYVTTHGTLLRVQAFLSQAPQPRGELIPGKS